MAQEDPLTQAVTMAEDLRTSMAASIDSVLSQGAEQVKKVSPKGPAAPEFELPTGSSSSRGMPGTPPASPLEELPELSQPPKTPKAKESTKEASSPTPAEEGEERKVEEPLH